MIRPLALIALLAFPLPLAAQTADEPLAGADVRALAMADVMTMGPAENCSTEIRTGRSGAACAEFQAKVAEVRRSRAPALAWCRADEAKRRANPVGGEVLSARPECDFLRAGEAELQERVNGLEKLAREQRR
jgi:hypothetical protein